MYLEHLSLTNFRNYSSITLDLGPGPVVLCGENAQGKSNILEAVYLLSTTKSPRANSDRELINWDACDDPLSVARLVAEVHRKSDTLRMEIAMGGGGETNSSPESSYLRKQIKINGVPRRATDAVGQLNAVFFSAQDVNLVGGAPSLRRRYLDVTFSQVDRTYLRALQRYTRVLAQRNHLLRLIREGSARREELEVWDRQLVDEGCYILWQRRCMISELAQLAMVIHSGMTGTSEALELTYLPNPPELLEEFVHWDRAEDLKEPFHRQLASRQDREVAQGMSVTGPHRDDLRFTINGADMELYGSRGQQRTIAAAVKLAEANFLMRRTGEDPVLLLDDILSELDESRRRQVLELALTNEQSILTTTDLDRIDGSFLSRATVFSVQQGRVEPLVLDS
ncbi:MAG: DNA replication/repair protein RecF [Dehalococcoidia bacterium]